MAGLSLRNIYKVYPGRNTQKKGLIRTVKERFKKTEQKADAVEKRSGNFVAVKNFNMEIKVILLPLSAGLAAESQQHCE